MANKRNGYIIRAKDIDVKSSGALEISQSSGLGVELGVLYDGTSIKLNSSGQLTVGEISLTEDQMSSLQGVAGPKGDQGPKGDKGDPGTNAKIGNVTASASQVEDTASAEASVTTTSSSETNTTDFAFTFKIPKGSTGPQGPQGESGASGAPGKHARIGSVTASAVTIDESSSASVEVSESSSYNEESSENITDLAFTFHIPKGVKGDKGEQGSTGSSGAPGKPARVGSVTATVSEISSDSSASVTVSESSNSDNGSENQTDLAFTFYLPKPAKGDRGERGEAGAAGKDAKIGKVSASATAVDATASPEASVSASSSEDGTTDFTFTFKIPRGSSGAQGEKGTSGEKGEQGPQGSAGADAHIGSITVKASTLPESSEASVEVSQSESSGEEGNITDLAFTFYIPKGSSGTAGAQGSKGDAGAPGRSAKIGKVSAVASSAESTASVSVSQSSSSGSSEDVTDLTFTFFIPKGEKGDQGSSGSQGPVGPAGKSIKLGSISAKAESLSYTAQPSVEVSASESSSDGDSSEVFENLTFTFKIPAGSPGEKGESGKDGTAGPKGDAGERGLGIELRSVTASLMEEPAAEEAPAEDSDKPSVSVAHTSTSSSDESNGSFWIHDLAFAFHIPKGPKGDAGEQGTSGPAGPKGDAGRGAKIGSVKAIASDASSGSPASVSLSQSTTSSTSEDVTDLTFTFFIPPGSTGPTGPSGDKGDTGAHGIGAKIGKVTAAVSQIDSASPASASVSDSSSSSSDSTNGEVWTHDLGFTFYIPSASPGPQGEQGEEGAPGKDAKIGKIEASVSQIASTATPSVTVTSSSGSADGEEESANVTDFVFTFHLPSASPGPAGKDGEAGSSGKAARVGSVSATVSMIPSDSEASVEVSESSNATNTSENQTDLGFTFYIPSAPPGPVGPAGKSGDRGETGPAGPSGSPGVGVAIRKVTASISPGAEEEAEEDGDSATVSVSCSSESSSLEDGSGTVWYHDLAFTFHIPKGPKGDKGEPGSSGSSGAKGDKGEHGIGMKLGSVTAAVSSISSGSPASVGISWGSSSSSDGTNGEVWTHDLGFTFYLPPGPQGPQGPQGTSGSSGAAGAKGEDGKSLKVGTVTTVTSMIPCSSSASVEVSASESSSAGDSSEVFENFTFTFHIPSGSPGPEGKSGASGSPGEKGADGKTLRVGSVTATADAIACSSQPSVEVSISESSSEENSSELFENFTFKFHIPSGSPGARGERGERGDAGSAGMGFMIKSVTATASPATDSPSAEVSFVNSSSDASMTYEDLAFTFYIPSGSPGKDGQSGAAGKDGAAGVGYKISSITAKASSLAAGSTPSATVSVTSSSSTSSMYYEQLEFTFYIPEGSSGAKGEDGKNGLSFKIGSVTASASSLSAGESPTASVAITSSSSSSDTWIEDLAFTFGIPAGAKGEDAKLGSPTASASMLPPGASPTASVSSSGDESSPSFHFDFGIPGTIQAPMLMFTRPDYDSALHLEVKYKELSDVPSDEPSDDSTEGDTAEGDTSSDDFKPLIDTGDESSGSSDCAKVFATANGSKWYKCPSSGFGAPFGGWPVAVDLTKCSSSGEEGGFDPTKRYYIKYRWYSNDKSAGTVISAPGEDGASSKNASDWYGMVYPPATEAPLSNSHKFVTTPPLLFTCPEFEDGLYLQVEYNDNPTSSGYQKLIDTADTSNGNKSRVKGNAGGNNWSEAPSSGFGTPFAGWPVMVDVSGLLDPSTISYIRYRWVAKEDLSSSVEEVAVDGEGSDTLTDVASDWYYMVYPAATEAPPLSYHGDEQYWVEVSDTSGTLSLSPDDGELQKFKLTSSTNLIPPTLDDIHQTLLLEFTRESSVPFMINSSTSMSINGSSGTFQVGWYWNGEKTMRYPVAEVFDDGGSNE